MSIPPKIEDTKAAFLGFTTRQVTIFLAAILVTGSLIVFVPVDLVYRFSTAAALFLLFMAIAFYQTRDGRYIENMILDWFGFSSRRRIFVRGAQSLPIGAPGEAVVFVRAAKTSALLAQKTHEQEWRAALVEFVREARRYGNLYDERLIEIYGREKTGLYITILLRNRLVSFTHRAVMPIDDRSAGGGSSRVVCYFTPNTGRALSHLRSERLIIPRDKP